MGSGIIDMTLRDYIKGYKDNVWYIVQVNRWSPESSGYGLVWVCIERQHVGTA